MLIPTNHFRRRCTERGIEPTALAPALAAHPRHYRGNRLARYAAGHLVITEGDYLITAYAPRPAWVKRTWARLPLVGVEQWT